MEDVLLEIGLASVFQTPRELSGRGVTLAVLDSGIDASHPFLDVADAVSTCAEPRGVPGRHGTHCAGIIASRSIEHPGIAPDVRLLDIKVADAGGVTGPDWLIRGIDEALDRGADILSISVGLNRFPRTSPGGHGWVCEGGRCVLCQAVDHAAACGALVVAAVGNEHLHARGLAREGGDLPDDIELLCPGQARGALAVGTLDKAPFSGRLEPRSSRGRTGDGALKPDLVAPGVDVLSTVPMPARLGFGRGSSVATAVVAGALALLVERRRALGLSCAPAEVRRELLQSCVRPLDAGRVLDLSRLTRGGSLLPPETR